MQNFIQIKALTGSTILNPDHIVAIYWDFTRDYASSDPEAQKMVLRIQTTKQDFLMSESVADATLPTRMLPAKLR